MVALEGVSPCLGISRHSLHNLYGCAGQDLLRPGDGENLRGKPLKNSSPQCKKITLLWETLRKPTNSNTAGRALNDLFFNIFSQVHSNNTPFCPESSPLLLWLPGAYRFATDPSGDRVVRHIPSVFAGELANSSHQSPTPSSTTGRPDGQPFALQFRMLAIPLIILYIQMEKK